MSLSQRPLKHLGDEAVTVTDPGIKLVIEALDRLRYGAIQLTIHEGRLVQVDVTERNRFSAS
jgi:hypothetical protein